MKPIFHLNLVNNDDVSLLFSSKYWFYCRKFNFEIKNTE